jgi:O-methyltransferase involved in polyketide biosynthesis
MTSMGKLQGVPDTLFIPLAARVSVSKKFPEYFFDEKALSLERRIPDGAIQKKSSEYSFMASVARYRNIDAMTRAFIRKNGKCSVVFLGAGLETAYYRLNEPSAAFYEVDLPDVIAARREALGEGENERLIAGDIFGMEWAEQVGKDAPALLVASGVFQYFKEDAVAGFIRDAKRTFPRAELIFDATNKEGIKYANKYVRKTGNTGALMYFYIDDGREFAERTGTELIEERVFFTEARAMLAKKLKLYTRLAMKVVDDKKRAILLHLAL